MVRVTLRIGRITGKTFEIPCEAVGYWISVAQHMGCGIELDNSSISELVNPRDTTMKWSTSSRFGRSVL